MEVNEIESALSKEGFRHTYVRRDTAETFYPDHTHDTLTAHIILDGQLTLTMTGKRKRIMLETAATSRLALCIPP